MPTRYEFRFQIQGPGGSRRQVLSEGETIIGRLPECTIQLDHPRVSKRHARVFCSARDCQITDLNSTNKTRVDGQVLSPELPSRLNPGATVLIGPFVLILERVDVEIAVEPEPLPPSVPYSPVPENPYGGGPAVAKKVEPAALVLEEPYPLTRTRSDPANPPPPILVKSIEPAAEHETFDAYQALKLGMESRQLIRLLPEIFQRDSINLEELRERRKTESAEERGSSTQIDKEEEETVRRLVPLKKYLGAFESILMPIQWMVDNFDIFLDFDSAPMEFLEWLSAWFGVVFLPGMKDEQKRALMKDAHKIYNSIGTRWALSRVLEIATGVKPVIEDLAADLPPDTFRVRIPPVKYRINHEQIEELVRSHKPAHTGFVVEYD